MSIIEGNVLLVGSTGGLGSAMFAYLANDKNVNVYASCRKKNEILEKIECSKIIEGIDLSKDDCGELLVKALDDVKLDYVIVVAGLFTQDTFDELKFDGMRKMMEICAYSPLRIVQALVKAEKLGEGGKVLLVTSEGGSIGLRTYEEGGNNYGHHMSKCAENMMGRLLAWDIKPKGIAVVMVHPGFLKTTMTDHYSHLYDKFGAVTPDVAVPEILKSAANLTLENTGRFVAPMGSKGLGLGEQALENPISPQGELPW